MPTFMESLAADVQAGLDDLTTTVTYKASSPASYRCKLGSQAMAGAASINLISPEAPLVSVPIGATVLISPYSTRFKATTAGTFINGALAGLGITPAAPSAMAASSTVFISTAATFQAKAIITGIDHTRAVPSALITAVSVRIVLSCATLPVTPKVGDQIETTDRTFTLRSASKDAPGAFWTCLGD